MSAIATQVEVRERPILFSGPMVKAILEGRKTQTRRVINPQPSEAWMNNPNIDWSEYYKRGRFGFKKYLWVCHPTENKEIVCPYGQVGDRLWVRETWAKAAPCVSVQPNIVYRANYNHPLDIQPHGYGIPELGNDTKWRPSIFMPRWASRITLEITNIRVERLHEIRVEDIVAEGVAPENNKAYPGHLGIYVEAWREGWDKINGKRKGCAWSNNPWLWVIEFKKL